MAAFRYGIAGSAAAIALLAASASFAQSATFHVTAVPNPAALREILTILRTVAGIQQVTADEAKFDLAVTGSEVEVALGAWIIKQLDRQNPDPVAGGYAIPGSSDVVRVLYTVHTDTQPGFNELITSLRSVGLVQRIFSYSPLHAIAMRTTAPEATMAEWMLHQLDIAPDDQTRWQPHEYGVPGTGGQMVKIVYLVHPVQQSNLNEMVTTIRTVADIERIFTRSQPQGIAFYTTTERARLADWLVQQLDVEPDNQMRAEKHAYPVGFAGGETVRVYYLNRTDGPAALRNMVQAIRAEVQSPRMFVCTAPRAVAIRGTPDVIAAADRAIKEYDRPAPP